MGDNKILVKFKMEVFEVTGHFGRKDCGSISLCPYLTAFNSLGHGSV